MELKKIKEQIDYAKFTENSIVTLDIDYAERLLLELTEQYESPTFEEVKKEWEELGYKLLYRQQDSTLIELFNENKMTIIIINNNEKSYIKLLAYDYSSYCPLNFQEHQLLTKTFKALGWGGYND